MKKILILITALLSCLTLQNLYATKMWVMNATGIPLKIRFKSNIPGGTGVPDLIKKVRVGRIEFGDDIIGNKLESFKINNQKVEIPEKKRKELFWGLEVFLDPKQLGAFSYRLIALKKWPSRQTTDIFVWRKGAFGPKVWKKTGWQYFFYGKGKGTIEEHLGVNTKDTIDILSGALYPGPFAEALCEAIQKNQIPLWEKTKELIKKKDTNVNIQFPDGDRPLHKIVELAPRMEIIKGLLERKEGKKADVNAKGMLDRRALQIAASKYPHAKLMDYLLEKGADRQAKDKFGSNVLHYIVTSPYLSFEDSAANINKLLSIKWATIDSNLMKMIDEKNKSNLSPLEAAKMQYSMAQSSRKTKEAERYRKLIKYLEDIKKKPRPKLSEKDIKKPTPGLSEKDRAALRQRWYGK